MVYFASGINLWSEWAKIESDTLRKQSYKLPQTHHKYAGIVVSLSRYEYPDTSSFTDSEIVWRMNKKWHIGLIVASDSSERVQELLNHYTQRIANEFHASLPAPDKTQ